MEAPSALPRPTPAQPDGLRIGVDFDAVRRRLEDCGIDAATRAALGRFGTKAPSSLR